MNRPSIDVDAIVREVAERLAAMLAPNAAESAHTCKNGAAAACSCGQGRSERADGSAAGTSGSSPATAAGRTLAGAMGTAAPGAMGTVAATTAARGGAGTAADTGSGAVAGVGPEACGCGGGKSSGQTCGCKHVSRRLELQEQVITAASLSGRLEGVQEVHIPQRAVVTPAANDLVREAGAVLVRRQTAASHSQAAVLVLGVAETNWAASGLLSALASAGVGVEQLARAGLRQTVEELADHAGRGGRRCMLLTARPYLGACLANRRAGVRAVVIERGADAQGAVAEAAANMAVLDPAGWSAFALHRFVQWYATAASRACPDELRHEEG